MTSMFTSASVQRRKRKTDKEPVNMVGKGKMWVIFLLVMCVSHFTVVAAWGGSSDSVLLKDVEVLTLYAGKMTAGRRSSPVPQLECVKGGTAPCDAFRPRVVQCYNRGWDGMDVQWECKTDMDNAYRFGSVEVSCEGYSHQDDPYILKGSCGLRYSIDYTQEGQEQQGYGHNYYGQSHEYGGRGHYGWNHQHSHDNDRMPTARGFADMIVYLAAGLMCYALYKTCVGSRQSHQDARSNTDDDYPAGGGGGGGYGWNLGGGAHHPTAPPPPTYYPDGASCRNQTAGGAGAAGAGGGGGGFWTGAMTGGLLGYMFGNRGGQNYGNHGGYTRPRGGGWSGGWGGGFGGTGGGFSAGAHASTGTRGASGFGGTSRR